MDQETVSTAETLLESMLHDEGFMRDGRRNDDMVNWLICQACVGSAFDTDDEETMMEAMMPYIKYDLDERWWYRPSILEHFRRINPYVESWVESGEPLCYMI